MEKRDPFCTVGGILSWYNHYGKQHGGTLENYTWNYHMTQHSHSWAYIQTKPFLKKDIYTLMFIAALFTIAKTWKQHKCPLTDDWIRKVWYIYTMGYYSAIRKTTMKFILSTDSFFHELFLYIL